MVIPYMSGAACNHPPATRPIDPTEPAAGSGIASFGHNPTQADVDLRGLSTEVSTLEGAATTRGRDARQDLVVEVPIDGSGCKAVLP